MKHLFCDCQFAQEFWLQLKIFLSNISINTCFDYNTICFEFISNHISKTLINFVILSAKYYIFKSKYIKTIPNILSFKNFLNKRMEIEKCIALEKDKLEQHNSKWRNFIQTTDQF